MIRKQPIEIQLLKQVYELGISIEEFSTDDKTGFWSYNILERWNNIVFSDQIIFLTDSEHENVVGFVLGTIMSDELITIENIYVSPNKHNSGIASEFLNIIHSLFVKKHKITIRAFIQEKNTKALSLFTANNYIQKAPTIWMSIKKNSLESSKNTELGFLDISQDFLSKQNQYNGRIKDYKKNLYVYSFDTIDEAKGYIYFSITPAIKKATIESIKVHCLSLNIRRTLESCLNIIDYMLHVGYSLITIHPKTTDYKVIKLAKDIGFKQGTIFIPMYLKIK